VNGPVTEIIDVDPVLKRMTFRVEVSATCTAVVTWRDGGEPGTTDTIALTFSGSDCPPDQTSGDAALDRGNIQWHSNVRAETSATAAAAGVFPRRTSFSGLTLDSWTTGAGVAVFSNQSALGSFEVSVDARSTAGEVRQLTMIGRPVRGALKKDGSVTFSGTATVDMGANSVAGVTFSVLMTSKGTLQLTIGTVALPSVKLGVGSLSID
jgi:hypothetical protein